MIGLLLLDLDGTVRRTISGSTFITDPMDQEIIPEAARAIADYISRGYRVTGITNQGGVWYGHKTFDSCVVEQRHTMRLEPNITAIYFCPNDGSECYAVWRDSNNAPTPIHSRHPTLKATFRKPASGMLKAAIAENEPTTEILYVGDRDEDYQAAQLAQVKFMWAKTWWQD